MPLAYLVAGAFSRPALRALSKCFIVARTPSSIEQFGTSPMVDSMVGASNSAGTRSGARSKVKSPLAAGSTSSIRLMSSAMAIRRPGTLQHTGSPDPVAARDDAMNMRAQSGA